MQGLTFAQHQRNTNQQTGGSMNIGKAMSLAALATSAALVAVPAAAQGWYAGLGIGQGDLDGAKDKETVWTARLGYMFMPYIGIEAAYYDLGKYTLEETSSVLTLRGTGEASAFGLAVLGVLPVNEMFQAYGRIGYARNKMDFKLNIDDDRFKARDKENAAYWGLGARYMFSRNLGAFAEYTKHEKVDVQSWMLGIHMGF
jgi:OOP family OmpA-OmpF porin